MQLSILWNGANGFFGMPGGNNLGPFPDDRQTLSITVTNFGSGYTAPVATFTGGTCVTPATPVIIVGTAGTSGSVPSIRSR